MTELLGYLKAINLNSAGSDNAITIPFSNYIIRKVTLINPSTSLGISVATLGLFTSTSGGGTTVVTAATMVALTGATKYIDSTLALTTDSLTAGTLYARNVLAHGSAATVDMYIFGNVII